ncbi:MAG: hypothetical protein ACUVYA_03075 [Planctomycetota bacterium]
MGRSTRLSRKRLSVCLSAALALSSASCCSPPAPRAEKYFDRKTPDDTLRGFVYAVETHQWGYAWDALAPSSQREIGSPLRFEAAIRFLEEPQSRVPIYELVTSALRLRSRRVLYSPERDRAAIDVVARGRDPQGTVVFLPFRAILERARDEWRLDLLRSLGVEPSSGASPEGAGPEPEPPPEP